MWRLLKKEKAEKNAFMQLNACSFSFCNSLFVRFLRCDPLESESCEDTRLHALLQDQMSLLEGY